MKHMKDVYGPSEYGWGDYEPMIKAFGDVIIQVDECDYQGDTWVVLRDEDGQHGYLEFGWGSCSGCDALQACDTIDEVNELAISIYESIRWFESKDAFREWFLTHDFEGDWCWHKEEFQQFRREVNEYINKTESNQ